MKLNGLKDTPKLYRGDIDDSIQYINKVKRGGEGEFHDHFHEIVADYLEGCVGKAESKLKPKQTECIVGFTVRPTLTPHIYGVSIYTAKSALSDVKAFCKAALDTRSQLTELRGKKQRRRDEYEYYLEVDLDDGEIHRSGKQIGNGIFRLVTLVHLLSKTL